MTPQAGRGLFLDLDGTLADSLGVMRMAYATFLRRFDKVPSQAEFDRLNGPPLDQVVDSLARTHRLTLPLDELTAIYRDVILAAYTDVAPRQGAENLLGTAKRLGRRIAVVTSNSSGLTRAWLVRVEFDKFVDAIVAGNDVDRGKPDPEPYRVALTKTECLADRSIAVEDSFLGAQASLGAGIKTFLLSAEKGHLSNAALCVPTLDDVTDFLLAEDRTGRLREQ